MSRRVVLRGENRQHTSPGSPELVQSQQGIRRIENPFFSTWQRLSYQQPGIIKSVSDRMVQDKQKYSHLPV